MDLKVVQLLRAAMGAADAAGVPGCASRLPLSPAATFEPRDHIHPTPVFEPRPRIHPTPKIEPRLVLKSQRDDSVIPGDPSLTVEMKKPTRPFEIQPPWKTLPWETPTPIQPRIKVVVRRSDIVNKGSLIDIFI